MKVVQNTCRKCEFFDKKKSKCSIKDGSPIRKCVIGINRQLLRELNSQKKKIRILEIGCGVWSPIKDGVAKQKNIEWRGIDVEREFNGVKTIATEIASVEKMPYPDNHFDIVLANESAEHWFEYGVDMKTALAEISRVLKLGGELHMNMPIHLHGDIIFMHGRVDTFLSRFNKKYWKIEAVEEWRRSPTPQKNYEPWKKDKLGNAVLGEHKPTTAWILNTKFKKLKTAKKTIATRLKNAILKTEFKMLPQRIRIARHYGIRAMIRFIRK